MTPTFVLICVYQGTTFRQTVTLRDSDGEPFDLADWSARMQIREHLHGPLVLELTSDNDRIELGADGEIAMTLDAATTAGLTVWADYEQYVYDLELYRVVGGTEEVQRPIFGTVVLYPEVTRSD